MRYTIERDDANGFFVVSVSGEFSFADFQALNEQLLAHPRWQLDAPCLFDYRETDFLMTPAVDLWHSYEMHRQYDHQIGGGRTALVCQEGANRRILESYIDIAQPMVDSRFGLFTDMAAARRWLVAAE